MNTKRLWTLMGIALTLSCASGQSPQSDPSTATHYHGFRLIAGDSSAAIENAAMVVDGGTIVSVGGSDSISAPTGAASVDLSGRTLMPLLHSLHAHVGYLRDGSMKAEHYTEESIWQDLDLHRHYGIGSVLALGSDPGDAAFDVRSAQANGNGRGARLFTVGQGVTSKGGWPTIIPAIAASPQQVETEEAAREAVRAMVEKKVDAIKIWVDDAGGRVPKISPELYRAAIDEASKHGLATFAHVFYLEDARGLVEAGISVLAHSIRDAPVDESLVAAMKANDVLYVPTLVAHELPLAHADGASWIGEASMRETVAEAIVEKIASDDFRSAAAAGASEAVRQQVAIAMANVKTLNDAGIRVGLGTDSGTTHRYPGYFEHREMELLVRAGLSAAQAIQAATQTSAVMLGQIGALSEGSPADFLVLHANPLADIANSRDIDAVYVGGEPVERLAPPGAE